MSSKTPLNLRYGNGTVELSFEGAATVTTLSENAVASVQDVPAALQYALGEGAIGCAPLCEQLCAKDRVTIVISDITRAWMHQDIITELLVRYLNEALGLPFEHITVLVALGTHRGQTEAEMRKTASDYAFEHVACVNHDARSDTLVDLGTTSRGTPVRVNPLIVGRKVITIGATVYHLLAGFGGGRKSLVPGVSGWDTIQKNHSLALHPVEPRSNDHVGLGITRDNPVHLDMLEAARMVAPTYSIHLVVNSAGGYAGILGGDIERAWDASCALAKQTFAVPIDKRYDAVIVSGGGFPKDINLYQGSKTLINAMEAVKPGGTVFFVSECCEGGGAPEFFDWIVPLSEGRLDEALRENFTIAGYIFYALVEFARRADIRMLTKLNPGQARQMGIQETADPDALFNGYDFSGKAVAIIPFGANVVPQPKK